MHVMDSSEQKLQGLFTCLGDTIFSAITMASSSEGKGHGVVRSYDTTSDISNNQSRTHLQGSKPAT